MFTKPIKNLTYSDIVDLIEDRKEPEGHKLDYKECIKEPEKAKKELSKDISAFANSAGGYLIIGVDKTGKITGTDRLVYKKPVEEWLNQTLHSNIDPQVFYHDPKVVEIPESDKVLVVIEVPESLRKPHMVNEGNKYFIRVNDSCKAANHYQVRDMFEFSNHRSEELNDFLEKKNLFDTESDNFGLTKSSPELHSDVDESKGFPRPLVLFSLIPKFPNSEKITLSTKDLKDWLQANEKGHQPFPGSSLYNPSWDMSLMLNGVKMKHSLERQLLSYFEINNNGYIEAGFSNSFVWAWERDGKYKVAFDLTYLIGYEMILLDFARKFYQRLQYYDDVVLQISFVNMLNLKLYGFHHKYNDMSRYERSETRNLHDKNFKLLYSFNSSTLTEERITEIGKETSETVSRVFGLDTDFCFVDDEISGNFSGFKLYAR